MSTWRKVSGCLFAAVCGVSAAFGEVAIQSAGDNGFGVYVNGLQDNTYRIVYVAVGDQDYGTNIANWPSCSSGVLATAGGTVTVPYPQKWGKEYTFARAFEYDRVTVADPVATGDYLTDGLVAHWDAVGATSTSEWVSLVGGYKFTLNNATVGNKVYAFATGAGSYGELDEKSSTTVLGDTSSSVTIEGVFANDGNESCYVFTGTEASMAFICYYGNTLILSGRGGNPTIAHKGAELATYSIAYNTDTTSGYRHRDREAVNGTVMESNGSSYWNRGGTTIQIGGKSPGVNADGACSIGAIRIYNRSLKEWEMKYNADVDKVRFYGEANPEPIHCSIHCWERGYGIHGREVSVDAINTDAEGKPVSAVLSFSPADIHDTLFCAYGETDGRDDLNAWNHVENVRAILASETSLVVPFPSGWGEADGPKYLRYFMRQGVEARSVVKDSLIAIWDGIDNVATGVHADETSRWIDLVAKRPINLFGAMIDEMSVGFVKDKNAYGALSEDDAAATFNAQGSVTWECRSVSTTGLELCGKTGRMCSPWGQVIYTSQNGPSKTCDKGSTFSSYHTVALCYTESLANNIMIDGTVPSSIRDNSGGWGSVVYPDGVGVVLAGYSEYDVACTFQTIRVYSKELSQAEATLNSVVDNARFKDGATLGAVESWTDTLTPDTDIRGKFTVRASVPHGTVTGAGEYNQGETVTLSVAMEKGYTFHHWLGDVPDGVDAYSPQITFTANAHRQIDGFILMPWETVTDSTGNLVAISNSVWHFAATVSDGEDGVTLSSSAVSPIGQSEALDKTVDLSTLQGDTGYRLTRLGANVFKGKSRLRSVSLACEDLLEIGDNAFSSSGVSRILPEEVFPNLETVGVEAFQAARRFVAPKVQSIGVRAFNGSSLTNFYPTTLAFPLSARLFYMQASLRGDFVIDSPSETIPEMLFGNCNSVSSFTFNSPVDTVKQWAFYGCSPRAKFYWNVPAPESFGDCAIGARGSQDAPSKPVPQLICATSKIAEDFKKFADGTTNFTLRVNFVPKEKIDPEFLTKEYRGDARLNRILGWLVSDGGGYGTFRIWVIGPRQDGTLLFIR